MSIRTISKLVSKWARGINKQLLKTSVADVLSSKKKVGGGEGGRPRVKNPKSPNGTETNQLTIYKRGRGFTRVIQILIR